MDRFAFYPVVGAAALALFIAHLGMHTLPGTIGGLPTPVLLLFGMAGAVSAAIRWL